MSLQGIRWLFLVCFYLLSSTLLAQPTMPPVFDAQVDSAGIVFYKNSAKIKKGSEDFEKLIRYAQHFDFSLFTIEQHVGEDETNQKKLLKQRAEIIQKNYSNWEF